MENESIERARRRLLALRERPAVDRSELEATIGRAREGLETLAQSAAELGASMPERLDGAIRESMREQVIPVARSLAEVRGLSNQTVRRLERLQADLDSERLARVEDLALLVDLVANGWKAVERRLDRLERTFDRLERVLDERASEAGPSRASVYRIDERHPRPGA